MSKTTNDMKARLSKSVRVTPREPARTATRKPAPARTTAPDTGKQAHVTFTLSQRDIDRLREIRTFMMGHGFDISRSEAVKLAVRAATPGNEMLTLYETVKADDGRR